ncbi:MAG TPA: hypothetical protein DCR55_05520 [Lentisphaeria bacterium]|nr:hypothetical protein [Lentisphaeria bacterium]
MRALAAALLCLCCAAVPPTEQQAQRLQLAHAQLESGNAESARRELSALLAEEPELDSARLLLGFTYYALGDKTAAESAFRQVLLDSLEAKALEGLVAVAPNSSGARLLLLLHGATPETLARCLDVLPSQELLPHLQDLVAQNPNAGNLFLLAAALHRSGDYEHAVRAYERAWYLGSDEVKPATLAGLHQHLGQVEDALLWLDRASDSDTPERRIMRAELLETTGELAEAQTIARVLIEDGAHTERALNVLIRTLPADAPNSEIAPYAKHATAAQMVILGHRAWHHDEAAEAVSYFANSTNLRPLDTASQMVLVQALRAVDRDLEARSALVTLVADHGLLPQISALLAQN